MGKSIRKTDKMVMDLLNNYSFPGNIRELKNMIERAVILCEGDTLLLDHFKIGKNNQDESRKPGLQKDTEPVSFDLEENIKRVVLKAMEQSGNNKSKAAKLLNITWQALDRRTKKYGLD